MSVFDKIPFLGGNTTKKDYFNGANPYSWAFAGLQPGYKANDILPKRSDAELMGYYRSFPKTAIDTIAIRTSQIEFQLEDENGEIIEKHWMLDLLAHPNDDMTGDELIRRISSNLDIIGRAPIFAPRIGRNTIEALIPLPPVNFKAQLDTQGRVLQYILQNGGAPVPYEKESIVFFRTFNPLNVYDGYSTTRAAIYAIETLFELENWEYTTIRNGAVPSFGISYKKELNSQQLDQVRTKVSQVLSGSNNGGQTLILSGESEYFKTGLSLADFSVTDMKNALRDIILGYYGVPKAVLGFVDDVNRANGDSSLTTFYQNVIDPRMRLITDGFQEFLIRPMLPGYKLSYKNPIPADKLNNAKIYQLALANQGWLTPNEVRAELNLDPVDGGDDLNSPVPVQVPVTNNNSQIPTDENNQSNSTQSNTEDQSPKAQKSLRIVRRSIFTADMDRDAKKKALDANARRVEAKCVSLVKDYTDGLQDRVIQALKSNKSFNVKAMIDNVYDNDTELQSTIDFLQVFYSYASKEYINEVIDELNLNKPVRPSNELKKHLDETLRESADLITGNTRQQLSDTLKQGVNSGEGISDLTDRIKSVCDNLKDSRAYSIAATESTGIANATHLDVYNQLGYDFKEWMSIHDNRTRTYYNGSEFDHVAADGEIVAINKPFTKSGEEIMYPGDPSASPGNRINCRCRIMSA